MKVAMKPEGLILSFDQVQRHRNQAYEQSDDQYGVRRSELDAAHHAGFQLRTSRLSLCGPP
jgi:hypothetical protein